MPLKTPKEPLSGPEATGCFSGGTWPGHATFRHRNR